MSFPEQIKAKREQLGLTQAKLASFLDVSPRAIWQWEKGKLPHILTQEGAIARLSKAERLYQVPNAAIRCHSDDSKKTPKQPE